MEPDDAVQKAAEVVADGADGNWHALDGAAASPESRQLLHFLRAIDAIGRVSRGPGKTEEVLRDSPAAPRTERTRWGPLELLERVGSGAFGEVYRAWDPRLEREVALKLLRRPSTRDGTAGLATTGVSSNSEAVEEGRLLARVRHPNVVTVHGADVVDGEVGVWMEFVRGQTLAQAVAAEGPFDAAAATRIGIDVCRALSAVHDAGLLHRDVKSQNVMRDDEGRTVLMDFGTVHDLAAEVARPGDGLEGTPLYLAPELFADCPATPSSDVYSVGVLLYHLVTGSYPVTAGSIEELREAHGRGRRQRLRDARPGLPRGFVRVVEKALAHAPEGRYESASAMEAALLALRRTGTARLPGRALVVLALTTACLAGVFLAAMAVRSSRVWAGAGKAGDSVVPQGHTPVRRQLADGHMFIATGPVTPDGRFLPGIGPDGTLAVLEVATGQLRRLTPSPSPDGGAMGGTAIFSPQLDHIAYVWEVGDAVEVRVAQAVGTNGRTVARYAGPLQHLAGWTPEGAALIVVRPSDDDGTAVERLDVASGARTPLLVLPSRPPTAAEISPDGRYFLYDGPPHPDEAQRDIFIADLLGGTTITAVAGESNETFPVWLRDGRGFLFASNRSGTNSLWLQEVREGRPAGAPTLIEGNIGRVKPLVSVSATGVVYYRQTTGLVDVFTAPLDLAANRVGEAAAVQAGQVGGHLFPDWSTDSRTVVFTWRGGEVDFDYRSTSLVLLGVANGEQEKVTPDTSRAAYPRLSPDGRQATIWGEKRGRTGLCLVDLSTGATRLLAAREGPRPAEWSPDGRFVLFADGASIRALDLDAGSDREVYRAAKGRSIGSHLVVSPSGRVALLESVDDRRQRLAMRVFSAGEMPHTVLELETPNISFELAGWTPDESEVLALRWTRQDQRGELVRLPLGGGPPRSTGFAQDSMRDVRVSPDGRWIAYTAGWPRITQWMIEHVVPPR